MSHDDELDLSPDRILKIADSKCTISAMDTAFSQMESTLSYLPLTLGNAAILVYSVTDATSFQMAIKLKQAIRQLDPHGWIPIALVATKHTSTLSDSDRMISMQDGMATAMTWDCPYFEIIAHDTTNNEVDMIFMTLVEKLSIQREQQRQLQQYATPFLTSSGGSNSSANDAMAGNSIMLSNSLQKSGNMSISTIESVIPIYYSLKQFFYNLIL
ncbi:hypothetical protein BDF22DRAFT_661911 [Syncephalis plumigaleata]|nr:hypothetical protein BDF22DRAFT_661911 [Syncephalis plumigaleata]